MPTKPLEQQESAHSPAVTVEEVLGAQVGNPPIVVNEDVPPSEEIVIAEEAPEQPPVAS